MWLLPWLLLALALVHASVAWGHGDPSAVASPSQDVPLGSPAPYLARPLPQPTPQADLPSALAIGIFFLAALASRGLPWRRRAAALCLTLLLLLFTFGLAIHSVHHLFDSRQAAQCLGYAASQHVSGTLMASWDLHAPNPVVEQPPLITFDFPHANPLLSPDQPRAPPTSAA